MCEYAQLLILWVVCCAVCATWYKEEKQADGALGSMEKLFLGQHL